MTNHSQPSEPAWDELVAEALRERDDDTERRVSEGVVVRETFGGSLDGRSGLCFELVLTAMLNRKLPEGSLLVFGTWGNQPPADHVWVELPDGTLWEPITATLGRADEQREHHRLAEYPTIPSRYTVPDAARSLVRHRKYGSLALLDAYSSQTPDAD